MKIGLLDSGIGGWSFLTKIEAEFPQHKYLYYADQINCPYGNKTFKELVYITEYWISVFKEEKLDILILACNTMTALFKEKFSSELGIPILGATDGLEKENIVEDGTLLLATVKTVKSNWYQEIFPKVKLQQVSSRWLAEVIENSFSLTNHELLWLKKEVDLKTTSSFHTIILGCTHYPLILEQLREVWPDKVFIDPADTIIQKIGPIVQNIPDPKEIDNNIIMFTTGSLKTLDSQVESFFKEEKRKKIKILPQTFK